MMFETFETVVDGYEGEQAALDYARGYSWEETETRQQSIEYARLIDVVGGVGVYYDYGADYYFYTDEG